MIAAIFVILCSSSIFVLFKLFNTHGINSRKAIIINYTTAVLASIAFNYQKIDFHLLLYARWLFPAVIVGLLFVANFYLMNLCTKSFNLSITAISSKMSVVIPVLLSVLVIGEPVRFLGIIGFLLAILSLYLILKPSGSMAPVSGSATPKKVLYRNLWIPLSLFLVSGSSDSLLKYSQNMLFGSNNPSVTISQQTHHSMFVMMIFTSCVFFAIVFALLAKENPFRHYKLKDIGGGISLGVVNFANGSFLVLALSQVSGVILFPLINISIVSISALIGVCFFKDKITVLNVIGLIIAAIALILIQL